MNTRKLCQICSKLKIKTLGVSRGPIYNCEPLREMCLYFEIFWSECGKIRTRKTPNTVTFYTVNIKQKTC